MPAEIVETQPRPFRKVEIDPITLDIIENAMLNARWEMDAVLFRTAMSPGIREQHDEFPMIANVEGKMVVGQFGSFIYGFLEAYEGTVEEGDIFLTSDPMPAMVRSATPTTGSFCDRFSKTGGYCPGRRCSAT